MKLPIRQRLALELNRSVNRTAVLEHKLSQLFWECTLRCNLNCRHCGSDCRATADSQDMPFEDFLRVLETSPDYIERGSVMVITTGGEPLVRKDIADCGQRIRKMGYRWGMVTNGMLLDGPMLDRLTSAGLDSLAMSFDGFEADHNWMRGSELSFDRALRALDLLLQTDNLAWDLITCVNRRNFDSISGLRDFLIAAGVKNWRIFTVVPMGRAKYDPELFLSDEQFRELMQFIAETRKDGRIRLDYSCEGFLGDWEGVARKAFYNCYAGVNVASVLADGSISGCLSIRSNYHQGNIYKDDFWQVWECGFQQYRNRHWMKCGACAECDAWRYCQGGPMHLRDNDGSMINCNYLKL